MGVREAIWERVEQPAVNKKGGLRFQLSHAWDEAIRRPSSSFITWPIRGLMNSGVSRRNVAKSELQNLIPVIDWIYLSLFLYCYPNNASTLGKFKGITNMSYCQLLQTLNAIFENTDAKAPSKISKVPTAEEKNRIEFDRLEKSGLTNLQVYSS